MRIPFLLAMSRSPWRATSASGFAFGVLLATGSLLFASQAQAVPLAFTCISNNLATDCGIGEAQLSGEVTASNGNVLFTFSNAGPAASTVTDVYFDDGVLGSLISIDNTGGVNFGTTGAPNDLPAGNSITPAFDATFEFHAANPSPANGINPGDTLGILFSLDPGADFDDVLADLNDGDLRIGLHVQAFASGGSESFVNNPPGDGGGGGPPPPPVPEPASLLLFAGGLGALALWRRRRPQ